MADARKDMYIVQVGNYVAALKPYKNKIFCYAPKEQFFDFISSLREDFPNLRLRCVKNKGIEEYAQKRITSELKAQAQEVLRLKQRLQR